MICDVSMETPQAGAHFFYCSWEVVQWPPIVVLDEGQEGHHQKAKQHAPHAFNANCNQWLKMEDVLEETVG